MNSSKKIILITGCNKGIGYTLVDNLIKENLYMNIIFTARNNNLGNSSFNKIISKYPSSRSSLFYHQLDITNKESIMSIINWIKQKFGKIDILFNNAGISNSPREQVIQTNVFGTFNITYNCFFKLFFYIIKNYSFFFSKRNCKFFKIFL